MPRNQLNHQQILGHDKADMMLALGFKDNLAWFAQLINVESA
jgi:hypothetical protein